MTHPDQNSIAGYICPVKRLEIGPAAMKTEITKLCCHCSVQKTFKLEHLLSWNLKSYCNGVDYKTQPFDSLHRLANRLFFVNN